MTDANPAAIRGGATSAEFAAPLLRVTSGLFPVLQGTLRLDVIAPAGTVGHVRTNGSPGLLASLTIATVILDGRRPLAGLQTSWVSLALVPVLLGAAWIGHGAPGVVSSHAGGWGIPVFWAIAMIALAPLGDGAFALGRRTR